jgi:hypothetical protein
VESLKFGAAKNPKEINRMDRIRTKGEKGKG